MQFYANTDLPFAEHTLADTVTCVGRGLHTGLKVVMAIMPAPAGSGIVFVRRDVTQVNNEVQARWDTVSDTQLCTTVSNASGIRVSTIEHLMAALRAAGVDNARIVLDAPEVAIMDGSSAPFLRLFSKAGVRAQDAERQVLVVDRPVSVTQGAAEASYIPSLLPWMDLSIDFPQRSIGRQRLSLPFSQKLFADEISGARTFGFQEQLQDLKRRGFARGSSLSNAVLIAGDRVVNCGGLRYSDEFVRHKYLDAVGDLALAGHIVVGHFKGHRSGHGLNNQLLREAFARRAVSLRPISEVHAQWLQFEREQRPRVGLASASGKVA